jgi:hypothetical protein
VVQLREAHVARRLGNGCNLDGMKAAFTERALWERESSLQDFKIHHMTPKYNPGNSKRKHRVPERHPAHALTSFHQCIARCKVHAKWKACNLQPGASTTRAAATQHHTALSKAYLNFTHLGIRILFRRERGVRIKRWVAGHGVHLPSHNLRLVQGILPEQSERTGHAKRLLKEG